MCRFKFGIICQLSLMNKLKLVADNLSLGKSILLVFMFRSKHDLSDKISNTHPVVSEDIAMKTFFDSEN